MPLLRHFCIFHLTIQIGFAYLTTTDFVRTRFAVYHMVCHVRVCCFKIFFTYATLDGKLRNGLFRCAVCADCHLAFPFFERSAGENCVVKQRIYQLALGELARVRVRQIGVAEIGPP